MALIKPTATRNKYRDHKNKNKYKLIININSLFKKETTFIYGNLAWIKRLWKIIIEENVKTLIKEHLYMKARLR